MPTVSKIAARLGVAVATARRERGLSQEALAERLDVSKNFIGLVERGRSFPSVPRLVDLSMALGLSLDRVLFDKGARDDRWPTETAAILGTVAPEYRDLAVGYLRSLAIMRPASPQPSRKMKGRSRRGTT